MDFVCSQFAREGAVQGERGGFLLGEQGWVLLVPVASGKATLDRVELETGHCRLGGMRRFIHSRQVIV